jgi:hypothetical protein
LSTNTISGCFSSKTNKAAIKLATNLMTKESFQKHRTDFVMLPIQSVKDFLANELIPK